MKSIWIVLLFCMTSAVGQTANAEEIARDLAELASADRSVKAEAIGRLYKKAIKGKGCLPVSESTRLHLESYLAQWGGNGAKAALLLGFLGDRRAIPSLRATKAGAAEMERKNDPMENRNCFAPDVQLACLKALLRLGDAGAQIEVRSLLQSSEVKNRANGIDCVVYAECETLVPYLLPMLNDKRNAVNIAPTSMEAWLRVCDLGVNALVDICGIKAAFYTEHDEGHGIRYSDEQVAVIRRAALAWMKRKKQ